MISNFLTDLENLGVSYTETISKASKLSKTTIHEYSFDNVFTVWMNTKKFANVKNMIRESDSQRCELISENGKRRGVFLKTITKIGRDLQTNYKENGED